MELKRKGFNTAFELTLFVNEKKITKRNVQEICKTQDGKWCLFWWEKR